MQSNPTMLDHELPSKWWMRAEPSTAKRSLGEDAQNARATGHELSLVQSRGPPVLRHAEPTAMPTAPIPGKPQSRSNCGTYWKCCVHPVNNHST